MRRETVLERAQRLERSPGHAIRRAIAQAKANAAGIAQRFADPDTATKPRPDAAKPVGQQLDMFPPATPAAEVP